MSIKNKISEFFNSSEVVGANGRAAGSRAKSLQKAVAAAALVVPLAACNVTNYKEIGGTVLGAAGGGLLGAQVGSGTTQLVMTGVGTLVGAFVGNQVGQSLDRADQLYAIEAERHALNARMGQAVHWDNPRSGNSGYFVPVREGRSTSGDYCREYQTVVTIGGRTQQAYGTACRKPDGSWQMVSAGELPRDHDFAEVFDPQEPEGPRFA